MNQAKAGPASAVFPGTSSKNRSFPSGHASVGFYLIAPWFILRRRNRVQAVCWLVGGLVYLSGEVLAQVMGLDRDEADGGAYR